MFDDLETPRRAHARGGRATSIACWWRGNELDHLGTDLDAAWASMPRRNCCSKWRPGRWRISRISACETLAQPCCVLFKSAAILGGHAVLRGERVRVAGRAVQGAGEHGLSDALAWATWSWPRVSVLWLGETLSPAKVLGIALICAGVVLVSRSSA